MAITRRYDFVYLFDVKDGNPNGDPDAGNLPRLDAETGDGLVTDVALKRKVRNFVAMTKEYVRPFDIYVRERAVLGRSHVEAFKDLDIQLGEETRLTIPPNLVDAVSALSLPDGVTLDADDPEATSLVLAPDMEKKAVQSWIKGAEMSAAVRKLFSDLAKQAKGRRPTRDETELGQAWMCKNFFDIRTFGAVLSLKSAPNCGQVMGPVQLTFARSVEPVVALEHSITRIAVATEAEAEKQQGDNRTMGRKHTVPYGLYRAHGFVSAYKAEKTGFDDGDLQLLWDALASMFEHDRSAARGQMACRGLYVFEHEGKLGNAHAHDLFDRIVVRRRDTAATPAREFVAYSVEFDGRTLAPGESVDAASGVRLTRRC